MGRQNYFLTCEFRAGLILKARYGRFEIFLDIFCQVPLHNDYLWRECGANAGRCYLLNLWQIFVFQVSLQLPRSGRWFTIIFLRSARSFRQFLKYVCPAFSVPLSACTAQAGGFRSGVQRTPRLNTLEGNPVQLGRGGKRQRSEIRRQRAEDEIAGFC